MHTPGGPPQTLMHLNTKHTLSHASYVHMQFAETKTRNKGTTNTKGVGWGWGQ